MQPRSTPCHQREPFGQLAVPALLHMQEAETGVQHAAEQVRERQVTEANAITEPPGHGPRTAGAPARSSVSGMDHSGAVGSRLLGERAGEARMQADVDEAASGSKQATTLPGEGSEVVHVAVRERRQHQVEGAIRERQPYNVTLNQGSHPRPGPLLGDPELVGRRINSHHRPAGVSQGDQMHASPTAQIDAPSRSRLHQAHDQRRGRRSGPAILSSYQSAFPS